MGAVGVAVCATGEPEGNPGEKAECTHRMRLRSVRARSAPMRLARDAHRVYLRFAVAGSVAARTWVSVGEGGSEERREAR